MGYVSGGNDGSTDDTFYLYGRPVASGSNTAIGKGHGNETRTGEPTLLVDGTTYKMSGKSTSRARASNVATIKTAAAHGLTTGDIVTMSGFGSSSYSKNEVAVTVVDSTTFTYSNSGTDETETADTAGRFIRKGIKLGSSSVQLSQESEFFHPDYLSGGTAIGDLTTTYTLSGSAKTLTTEAAGTIDIAFRHSSSYGVLASYWSGSPSTKGPVYPGTATAKAYTPEQSETALSNDDSSSILSGQSLVFLLSRAASDLASALAITSTTGNSEFSSSWNTFIEDRSGGSVEKIYLKLPNAGTVDTSAGWSFDYESERVDGSASGAKSSSIFTD